MKFYQDECYSLYCNSTKTWRIVCACRGDLCNGPHTARETQAFALLPKYVKTKPRKRNLVSHFIGIRTRTPADDDTIIIISKENETIYSLQSDQPIQPNENTSNLYTPTPKNAEDNIIIVHGTLKNDEDNIDHAPINKAENDAEKTMHSVETTMSAAEDTHLDGAKKDKEPNNAEVDNHIGIAAVDKSLGNVDKNLVNSEEPKHLSHAETDVHLNSTEISKHLESSERGKHLNNTETDEINKTEENNHRLDNSEVDKNLTKAETGKLASVEMGITTAVTTTAAKFAKENHDSTVVATTSTKPTAEIAVAVQSSATPGKLPPAEALQQNVTPTKAVEPTPMGTVAMTTENHVIETTTHPTPTINPNKNNSGAQNLSHLIIFVISFLVHVCV